jgi:hypothetical protein
MKIWGWVLGEMLLLVVVVLLLLVAFVVGI